MKNFKLTYLFIALFFIVSACSKKGDTGPQGPQGPQGYANVNVVDFTVLTTDWGAGLVSDEIVASYSVSIITQDIVDNGAVFVYFQDDPSTDKWEPLPLALNNGTMYFSYLPGVLEIHLESYSGTPSTPTSDYVYKVVAVEGSVMQQKSTINWKNYNEVKKIFHLK